jgi:hypothetical protein
LSEPVQPVMQKLQHTTLVLLLVHNSELRFGITPVSWRVAGLGSD